MAAIGDIQLTSAALPKETPQKSGGIVYGEVEVDKKAPEELKNEALPRETVEQFMLEVRQQPAWRREADRAVDYYDGNQLSPETVERLQDRGQPPLITNLIKPTIDTVLGMEAKTRTDWRVRPEDDNVANDDTADALSLKLKHAETESRADRACSDAYAAQLKAGLGFVEVAREQDPLKYPYRVKAIHRREIFWDWRSEQYDLSDARYQIRRRWLDIEAAIAMMPQYATLFRNSIASWSGFDPLLEEDTHLVQSWEIERDSRMEATDWRDAELRRVCINEIWYRKWVRGYVMTLSNGVTVEVDFDNPRHNEAIASGMVNVKMATFQKIRLAWYCGPHFLYDVPSPYKHNNFPYVPFFGYREDLTTVPYGLVRAMLSPQDEVNARKSKMLWSLNSKRVITDSDAVKDHARAAKEVGRPDAYIILDANRRPSSSFKVEPGGELAAQQFQVMQEAKQEIAESSGIHKAMQGQQSGASSGLAINSLVEQGLNTLGEINDNFRFARRMVGEMLFSMIQEDLQGRPTNVTIGKGNSQKIVTLNMPTQDPQTGEISLQNDVSKVRAKVVLDDIPSTPTFRMQQLQMLTEITKSLPPQAQSLIIDFVIEATDLAGSQKIADRLRKGLNLPDDSPEAQQQQQAMQQQQQAIQQQQIALEMQERQAKVEQINAATQKTLSEIGQGDGQAMQQVHEQSQQAIAALNDQIKSLEQQLFTKDIEKKSSDDAITLKTHSDIEQAKIDATTALQREREITQRELEKAQIAADAQVAAAKVQADSTKEVDLLRQQIAALQQELSKKETEAKEKPEKEDDGSKGEESGALAAALTALAQNQTAMASIMAAPRETKIVEDENGRATGAVSTVKKSTQKDK